MIKRTLYFGNPSYLRLKDKQLKVMKPKESEETASVPIEDIGVLLMDHPQITLSNALLAALIENNVAVIGCDNSHHPTGLFLPLEGHILQSKRFKQQVEASEALRKNLWAQTVHAKVLNQAKLLELSNINPKQLYTLLPQIKSGDSQNIEGRAARIYWPLATQDNSFVRDRYGFPPNSQLNYAYAILRASVARALVSTGLLPTLGIFHKNQYNAYCLADDIMEPYRPFCDQIVLKMYSQNELEFNELSMEQKTEILKLLTADVLIGKKKSPLMIAINRTTYSLVECFEGNRRKILYPTFYESSCN
ncbi:MAG: type II CRISPR-associated endonuclease Cas1 [Bacteroidales bacterium]|jgi:CRISPR-associated protein Cas1|nr:type II CRISPR-associated endonuclease Cas1 [Bacteroidales bacterium]